MPGKEWEQGIIIMNDLNTELIPNNHYGMFNIQVSPALQLMTRITTFL